MEGLEISVNETKKNLQAFEGKIRRGKSLERAAEECGLNIAEAQEYLESKRGTSAFDDDTLRVCAAEALHYGLAKLIKIAKAGPREVMSHETVEMGSTRTQLESTDLDAAKALVRFALDARKVLGMKASKHDSEPKDLFDLPNGSWNLRE